MCIYPHQSITKISFRNGVWEETGVKFYDKNAEKERERERGDEEKLANDTYTHLLHLSNYLVCDIKVESGKVL